MEHPKDDDVPSGARIQTMARVFVQIGCLYGDDEQGFRYESIEETSRTFVEQFKALVNDASQRHEVGGTYRPSHTIEGSSDLQAMEILAEHLEQDTANGLRLEIECLPKASPRTEAT